ncbi:hypothetical protein LOZ12_004530 [Ophidiomyces ophidiicola]|uniref:Uncharacterized protein n=1 Tax=Ophidiomyces ophidiicola TaxID=1387563 RepID=A0ACB8V336_9EURO|nr:hypothetical protein LOZ64_004800 [Ophidiomyces ophidiicola]KAI1954724.1 hypothetical protein LOZ62_000739 [Ophidiomyces ophidiicola]KAI1973444.1 hypothetical protein LOZ56_001882 [Ophidiomyces ophidiicola]KAI2007624.1 hypothetical protein LOZ50_002500 [Ophidiomyces ophidiicola]KAI2019588.1 hypothetical protein LOZ46_003229 [Ophidiomyces ophidiicola]
MAQTPQTSFQLFPNVQSQNHLHGQPRKGHRRRSTRSPTVSPVAEDVKIPGQTETVILQIIEDTNAITSPPPARVNQSRLPPVLSETPENTTKSSNSRKAPSFSSVAQPQFAACFEIETQQPVGQKPKGRSFSTPSPSDPFPFRSSPAQYNTPAEPYETTLFGSNFPSSDTPIRCGSSASARSNNPSHAEKKSVSSHIKSIFPLYDPNVPLSKQKYYPHRASSLPQIIIPTSERDTRPAPVLIPLNLTTCPPTARKASVSFSSTDTLTKLWDTSNGERSVTDLDTFYLKMRKIDAFTFVFGSQTSPFYTLRTNPMNDLEIHRTHPKRPNTKSPVMTLNIGDASRESHGGISLALFPKLAELLTREHALEFARKNNLPPLNAMQAENDALMRSEAQNSCILELKPAQSQYNIYYPTLLGLGMAPTHGQGPSHPPSQFGVLHATVLTTLPHTIAMRQYPIIQIAPPNADLNTQAPLVSLDLESMALSINVRQILATTRSFYGIDTMVSSILTVALSNETSRSILSSMSIQSPRPSVVPPLYREDSPQPELPARNAGVQLIATQAEREDVEEAMLMDQIRSQPRPHAKQRFSLMSILPWKPESDEPTKVKDKKKSKKKAKPVAVEEFDLEQYGSNAKGAYEKQKLPRTSRVILKFISWAFSATIWILTKAVKFLVWVVVTITKRMTREKS